MYCVHVYMCVQMKNHNSLGYCVRSMINRCMYMIDLIGHRDKVYMYMVPMSRMCLANTRAHHVHVHCTYVSVSIHHVIQNKYIVCCQVSCTCVHVTWVHIPPLKKGESERSQVLLCCPCLVYTGFSFLHMYTYSLVNHIE